MSIDSALSPLPPEIAGTVVCALSSTLARARHATTGRSRK